MTRSAKRCPCCCQCSRPRRGGRRDGRCEPLNRRHQPQSSPSWASPNHLMMHGVTLPSRGLSLSGGTAAAAAAAGGAGGTAHGRRATAAGCSRGAGSCQPLRRCAASAAGHHQPRWWRADRHTQPVVLPVHQRRPTAFRAAAAAQARRARRHRPRHPRDHPARGRALGDHCLRDDPRADAEGLCHGAGRGAHEAGCAADGADTRRLPRVGDV
mmetsp:Transcript_36989/g.73867  ORF Transcript_36989/g.73867 Transcript_36989/m.73867 type:complete len:212 (+) Transcript_36989:918-1553(+)